MAYRLKTVRYQNSDCKILLQNENGPCPLLAAANALLLKKSISLPSESIASGVASIDHVVNVLAEKALSFSSSNTNNKTNMDHSVHHLDDLMNTFPKLQYGMDINIKFTQGVTGVEYTSSLTAFDLLGVDLVHGWLLDPQDKETHTLVGQKTYNELVEVVVQGNEASEQVQDLTKQIADIETKLQVLDNKKVVEDVEESNKEAEEAKDKEEGEEWVNVKSTNAGDEDAKDETSPSASDEAKASDVSDTAQPAANDTTTEEKQVDSPATKVATANEASVTTGNVDQEETESSDEPVLVNEADADGNSDTEPTTKGDTETTNEPAKEKAPEDDKDTPTTDDEPPLTKHELETQLAQLKQKREKLSTIATNGSVINSFLSSTGHQLTHYGLHELYEYLQEEALCVFFRNNHFCTLTKHKGVLYLLVTDLGYANVPEVMWEKLDGIDGDTEYVNASFLKPAPQTSLKPAPGPCLDPKDVLAQRGQVDADMQLALQLSKHTSTAAATTTTTTTMDEEEGKLMAAATEASLRSYNGIEDDEECKTEITAPLQGTVADIPTNATVASNNGLVDGCSTQEDSDKLIAMQMQAQMDNEDASLQLARRLQAQEERKQAAAARNNTGGSSKSSNCVIS